MPALDQGRCGEGCGSAHRCLGRESSEERLAAYRTRYAANLKRELPRIPMAPGFHKYAEIGAALMKLHIEYEQQVEYPLERRETGKLNWRVEKMALSKDKTQLPP